MTRDVKHKIHQVGLQIKQIDSHKVRSKCPPLDEHKPASVLATGQLRHQSATAPSHATHTADAVAARQCQEIWSHTHVAVRETKTCKWPICTGHSFLFPNVSKLLKFIKIFKSYDHDCAATFFFGSQCSETASWAMLGSWMGAAVYGRPMPIYFAVHESCIL